ncbi:MAG: cupin domain-containing protein [Candidatus Obscuribacterales bacterium]|nr:cupin domain-containing protein [Candidatus Obscuribacterales bacterium]
MAILSIPVTGESFSDAEKIRDFLRPFGIWYENWPTAGKGLKQASSDNEILSAYSEEIETLKLRASFVTADVINVNPDTEGLEAMLAKFSKEHTHSEDELRFCIEGRGIFHINPQSSAVFSIEMEAGDLINVPAGTRHWFNLCAEKSIRVIRLFEDSTGWTPHYLENGVDSQYETLCFSELKIKSDDVRTSVVKP